MKNHWNNISIFWKSKSGKDIKLDSTDIDCNNVEFWVEKLDTALYLEQLYPNDKLPFKLASLDFKLVVTRINSEDCTLNTRLVESKLNEMHIVISQPHQCVEAFNLKSEKANRKYGVVHNSYSIEEENGKFLYHPDLGSAGVPVLKKLFNRMSEMNCFKSVEIE